MPARRPPPSGRRWKFQPHPVRVPPATVPSLLPASCRPAFCYTPPSCLPGFVFKLASIFTPPSESGLIRFPFENPSQARHDRAVQRPDIQAGQLRYRVIDGHLPGARALVLCAVRTVEARRKSQGLRDAEFSRIAVFNMAVQQPSLIPDVDSRFHCPGQRFILDTLHTEARRQDEDWTKFERSPKTNWGCPGSWTAPVSSFPYTACVRGPAALEQVPAAGKGRGSKRAGTPYPKGAASERPDRKGRRQHGAPA